MLEYLTLSRVIDRECSRADNLRMQQLELRPYLPPPNYTGMIMLCEQNGYVNRRVYRRAQAVVGVARIDQTLHIICCGFSSQTAGFV
jgi:hypothetical protein